MNSALYAACAGLVARTDALDTVAANVANSSSAGFRGQQNIFGTVLEAAAHHRHLSSLNQATNSYGVLSGTRLDQTEGTISHTGNPLDLALEGEGYFKVQTANGVAYTRNGAFQVSSSGQLTTATGDPVLGDSGTIALPKGTLSVSADGTLSVGGSVAGKLRLVTFPPSTALTSRGTGLYAAPTGTAEGTGRASVQQGALESSNVNPVQGMVELISAQRSAESMRHVLSMLDSEMDKTAVQDLPRVS